MVKTRKQDIRRLQIVLVLAILLTLFLIVNSEQFRGAGIVVLILGILAWLGYQRGGFL